MAKRQPKRVNRTMYCYSLLLTPRAHHANFGWRDLFTRFQTVKVDNIERLDETNALLMVVERLEDDEVRGHFSRLRDEWPRILDFVDGSESHMPLKISQSVIERAHFIYYPKKNIMVAEYNHFGTRAFGRFGSYVTDLVDEIAQCELLPFVRYDALQEAARKKGRYRKFSLNITPPALPIIEEAMDLGVSKTLGNMDNVDTEIIIKMEFSAQRQRLPEEAQNAIGRVITAFQKGLDRNSVRAAKITADESVDLLGGEYFGTATVMSVEENTRVVRDSDMYDALARFYNDKVLESLPKLRLRGK